MMEFCIQISGYPLNIDSFNGHNLKYNYVLDFIALKDFLLLESEKQIKIINKYPIELKYINEPSEIL